MAKRIIKTINRTGKKITKNSLVLRAKKQTEATKKRIAEINEDVKAAKKIDAEEIAVEEIVSKDGQVSVSTPTKKAEVEIKKKYKVSIDIKNMFDAGCHLGHRSSKTNPKAREYIFDTRKGVEIFDLPQTLKLLEEACTYIHNLADQKYQMVFVGTKRQAKEAVRRIALDVNMPYVTGRWLGGLITNWDQVKLNIKKYNKLSEGMAKGEYAGLSKREQSEIRKEINRLEKMVGGLSKLQNLPIAIFVVGVGHEKTAVAEAKLRGIKTIGICDSDCDPNLVDYPIVCNDDNVKSINLILEEVGRSIKNG